MARELVLPDWAKEIGNGVIEANAEMFYPELLKELGVKEEDVDQYWLTVVFHCAKMDIQMAAAGTKYAEAVRGGALRIHVLDDTKRNRKGLSKWALKAHPKGKGEEAGSKKAKEHYQQIRPGISF